MLQELKPGAPLELVTAAEIRVVLEEMAAGYLRPPNLERDVAAIQLDDDGDGSVDVYRVKVGYVFALHRLVVDVEGGYTPGVPFTSDTGYANILRNGQMEDFVTFRNGIPAVYAQNGDAAIRFSNADKFSLEVFGGPADTAIVCRFQGTLQPLTRE